MSGCRDIWMGFWRLGIVLSLFLTGCTASLVQSAKSGDAKAVQTLLDKGVNPNTMDEHGDTPLLESVSSSQADVVNLLLSHGADPNLAENRKRGLDLFGLPRRINEVVTPLGIAVRKGDMDMVKILLIHGADVNQRCNSLGQTPLLIAIDDGDLNIVKLLLSKGGNPNLGNYNGITPLEVAVQSRKAELLVKVLLAHGANVNQADKYGRLPIDLAAKRGNPIIIGLLLDSSFARKAKQEEKQVYIKKRLPTI